MALLPFILNHWYSTYMDTQLQTPPATNTRSLLLPYTLTLIVAMTIVQAVIALTGGNITLLAGGLTAVVAVGIAIWLVRNYGELTHVRFGVAIAHAIAFAAVTTSFNLHALVRTVILAGGDGGVMAAAQNLLATPWFGATLGMSALWGLGLLAHLTGTVLGRGWED